MEAANIRYGMHGRSKAPEPGGEERLEWRKTTLVLIQDASCRGCTRE
jgi:hypothetical protein